MAAIGTMANLNRPTSSSPSSRPQRSRMSSPSGRPCSPRCALPSIVGENIILIYKQALEGKDVKDLLLNVGSGGGAAPAAGAASGGAAGAAEADAPAAEEKKEEGASAHTNIQVRPRTWLTNQQRRRSQTRTWASVSSTKRTTSLPFFEICLLRGCTTDYQRAYSHCWGRNSHDLSVTRLAYGPSPEEQRWRHEIC